MDKKLLFLILTISVSIGISLRLSTLNLPFVLLDERPTLLLSSGNDELKTYAKLPKNEIISGRKIINAFYIPKENESVWENWSHFWNSDPHVSSIYYFMVSLALRIDFFENPLTAARFVSFIGSLLSLFGIFWICRELFEKKSYALIGVVLFLFSPLQLMLATWARPYGWWVSITLLATASLVWCFRRSSYKRWAIYSFLVILSLHLQLLSIITIFCHSIYVFVFEKKYKKFFLTSLGIAFLLSSPLIFNLINHGDRVANLLHWLTLADDLPKSTLRYAITHLIRSNFVLDTYKDIYGKYSLAIIIQNLAIFIMISFSILDLYRNKNFSKLTMLLMLYLSFPMLMYTADLMVGGRRFYNERYLIISMTIPLIWIVNLVGSKLKKNISYVFLGILVASSFHASWQYKQGVSISKNDRLLNDISLFLEDKENVILVSTGLIRVPTELSLLSKESRYLFIEQNEDTFNLLSELSIKYKVLIFDLDILKEWWPQNEKLALETFEKIKSKFQLVRLENNPYFWTFANR